MTFLILVVIILDWLEAISLNSFWREAVTALLAVSITYLRFFSPSMGLLRKRPPGRRS